MAHTSPAYPALGVAAKAIVSRDDGTILIIKRAPTSSTDPGRWDLPGGKMDYGEALVDTLVRETLEETGLIVTPGPPIVVTHFIKEPFWVTCVTFECRSFRGDVRYSDEHVDHAWISPTDVAGREYAQSVREQLEAYVDLLDGESARAGSSVHGHG